RSRGRGRRTGSWRPTPPGNSRPWWSVARWLVRRPGHRPAAGRTTGLRWRDTSMAMELSPVRVWKEGLTFLQIGRFPCGAELPGLRNSERLVCRSELFPARLPGRLASRQVAPEVLDVRLPPGAMQVEDVQRQRALLDDE